MTWKHVELKDSPIMQSYEKVAVEKGLIKEADLENIMKKASEQRKSMEPTDNIYLDLIALANGLREKGFISESEDLENKIFMCKQAETHLYRVFDEDGEDLLQSAHPDGDVEISESTGGHGIAETLQSAHEKIKDVAEKDPVGKYARDSKTTKTAESQILHSAVGDVVQQFIANYPTQSNVSKFSSSLLNMLNDTMYDYFDRVIIPGVKSLAAKLPDFTEEQILKRATYYYAFLLKRDLVKKIVGIAPVKEIKVLPNIDAAEKFAVDTFNKITRVMKTYADTAIDKIFNDFRRKESLDTNDIVRQTEIALGMIKTAAKTQEQAIAWLDKAGGILPQFFLSFFGKGVHEIEALSWLGEEAEGDTQEQQARLLSLKFLPFFKIMMRGLIKVGIDPEHCFNYIVEGLYDGVDKHIRAYTLSDNVLVFSDLWHDVGLSRYYNYLKSGEKVWLEGFPKEKKEKITFRSGVKAAFARLIRDNLKKAFAITFKWQPKDNKGKIAKDTKLDALEAYIKAIDLLYPNLDDSVKSDKPVHINTLNDALNKAGDTTSFAKATLEGLLDWSEKEANWDYNKNADVNYRSIIEKTAQPAPGAGGYGRQGKTSPKAGKTPQISVKQPSSSIAGSIPVNKEVRAMQLALHDFASALQKQDPNISPSDIAILINTGDDKLRTKTDGRWGKNTRDALAKAEKIRKEKKLSGKELHILPVNQYTSRATYNIGVLNEMVKAAGGTPVIKPGEKPTSAIKKETVEYDFIPPGEVTNFQRVRLESVPGSIPLLGNDISSLIAAFDFAKKAGTIKTVLWEEKDEYGGIVSHHAIPSKLFIRYINWLSLRAKTLYSQNPDAKNAEYKQYTSALLQRAKEFISGKADFFVTRDMLRSFETGKGSILSPVPAMVSPGVPADEWSELLAFIKARPALLTAIQQAYGNVKGARTRGEQRDAYQDLLNLFATAAKAKRRKDDRDITGREVALESPAGGFKGYTSQLPFDHEIHLRRRYWNPIFMGIFGTTTLSLSTFRMDTKTLVDTLEDARKMGEGSFTEQQEKAIQEWAAENAHIDTRSLTWDANRKEYYVYQRIPGYVRGPRGLVEHPGIHEGRIVYLSSIPIANANMDRLRGLYSPMLSTINILEALKGEINRVGREWSMIVPETVEEKLGTDLRYYTNRWVSAINSHQARLNKGIRELRGRIQRG